MGFKNIYLLPVVLFILVPVSFLTTLFWPGQLTATFSVHGRDSVYLLTQIRTVYTIAVLNEHVEPGFPYISDTGTLPPESCIFGQLLNIAAFMFAVCVYVKYVQVQSFSQMVTPEIGVSHTFNKVALSFGLTSCFGLDIVANFQESNVIVVHMLGAFFCFAAGTIYFILQVWISYKIPGLSSKHLMLLRIFLVSICAITTVSTVLTAALAFSEHKGPSFTQKWRPDDGGWELHLASTISEWVLCITYCVLVLSFVPEFYNLELEAPVIRFIHDENANKKAIHF